MQPKFGTEPDFRLGDSSGRSGLSAAMHVQQTERLSNPFNGALFDATLERLSARFPRLERFERIRPLADFSWRSGQADPKLHAAKSVELDGSSGRRRERGNNSGLIRWILRCAVTGASDGTDQTRLQLPELGCRHH